MCFLVWLQPDHIKKGYCPRLPGVRMPATYINHYCANGGVVVPQFGGWAAETDALAIETLQVRLQYLIDPSRVVGCRQARGYTSLPHAAAI